MRLELQAVAVVLLALRTSRGHPYSHVGVWNSPTTHTPSKQVSDGPLTAGGDFGAVFSLPGSGGDENTSIAAYFGKNDVWSDAIFQGGDGWLFQHLAVGSLAFGAPDLHEVGSVAATQSFQPAVVTAGMASSSGTGNISITESYVGARTRTFVARVSVTGLPQVGLDLKVPTESPAKAQFKGLDHGLPTWAGVRGSVYTVVRRSNYARYAPAVLGSATPSQGLLRGVRELRLDAQTSQLQSRSDGPLSFEPARPGPYCLAPLPEKEPLAPWAFPYANSSSGGAPVPVVTMACSETAAQAGAWSMPGGDGSKQDQLVWTPSSSSSSSSGDSMCVDSNTNGSTLWLTSCNSSSTHGWYSQAAPADHLTPGDAPASNGWQWVCLSSGKGCLISVPELSDRDVALAMRVLVEEKSSGKWVDAVPAGSPVVGASRVNPFFNCDQEQQEFVVVVQAATVRDHPTQPPPPPPAPGSDDFPAAALAATEVLQFPGPDEARKAHDAWWDAWWEGSVIDLLSEGTVCDGGATGSSAPGCVLDGFLVGMDYLRGASGQSGGVVPSLWGPFNNLDPAAWRDDVTIDYNVEANMFGASALGRLELFEPYAEFAGVLYNMSKLRTGVNWSVGGSPHSHSMGTGTADVTMSVSRASIGFPDPASFQGLSAPNSCGPFGGQAFYTDWGNRWPAAMFAAPLVDWYMHTMNDTLLRETVYPWVTGVADFYASYAVQSPTNSSWLDLIPSCGQESCHQRTGGPSPPYELQVSADLGLARYMLTQSIDLAAAAGMQNASKIQRWRAVRDSLAPFALTSDSEPQVASGMTPKGEVVPPYGNYNTPLVDTMPVYPGRVVTRRSQDVELMQAFNRTAWALGNKSEWRPQNGLCSAWPAAARLCDNGDCSASLLEAFEGALLKTMNPNFWPSLGGGGLEQMGAVDAIINLLADVDSETAEFLPAWDATRPAKVRGLRSRGGFKLSFDAPLVDVNVTSTVGGDFSFYPPFEGPKVVDETAGGAPVRVGPGEAEGSLVFSTEAGHVYGIYK